MATPSLVITAPLFKREFPQKKRRVSFLKRSVHSKKMASHFLSITAPLFKRTFPQKKLGIHFLKMGTDSKKRAAPLLKRKHSCVAVRLCSKEIIGEHGTWAAHFSDGLASAFSVKRTFWIGSRESKVRMEQGEIRKNLLP